ncbi:MAG: hypothetical protein H6735_03340 [Alphaproteobacteria bacterium]|nr:hypothetical protein [Alphaproteobacteria bacterium]
MSWLLAMALTAVATAGPVEKADKSLAAFGSGDAASLQVAVERADAAVAKLPADPAAWGVQARVWLAVATHPGTVQVDGDPLATSLAAFEKAVELKVSGAARAELEPKAGSLESTLLAALTNHVEGKQWSDAETGLGLAMRAHAVCDALGQADADRGTNLYALATRVHAQTGDLASAEADYALLLEARGRDDAGLAALVARKLVDGGKAEEALAFLQPIVERRPDDDRLLRATIEVLNGLGRQAEAIALIDRAADRLASSVSGAWLAAQLYDEAGQVTSARRMWDAVLALDEQHVDSHLALARSLLAQAGEEAAELDGESAARKPYRERMQIEQRVVGSLDLALTHAEAAARIAPERRDALEAWIETLAARLQRFPRNPTQADRVRIKAMSVDLDKAKAALAALGEAQ